MNEGASRLSSSILTAIGLLCVVCLFLFFQNLGDDEVQSETEARVLLTVGKMNADQTWVVPVTGGEGRWMRPPLYLWSLKLLSKFESVVSPQIGRLPAAASGLGLALIGALWFLSFTRRYPREDNPNLPPETMGLFAGLLIATSPVIFSASRVAQPEVMFAMFTFASLFCFGESIEVRRSFYHGWPWQRWVLIGYFLLGLAILTHGPLALAFVLLPYIATCQTYKMRIPNWIHLPGLFIALAVGGWWYWAAIRINASAWESLSNEFFVRLLDPEGARDDWYYYIKLILRDFFPWSLVAIMLVYRALVMSERNPSRIIWSWSFLGGTLLLSLLPEKDESIFLPIAPLILMLTADGLLHWDFEHKTGRAFRGFIRTIRWVLILIAIPASVIISSELGVALSIILIIGSVYLVFRHMKATQVYDAWERTLHASAMLMGVFFCYEAVYIRDQIPRSEHLGENRNFIAQVKAHLPTDATLFIYGDEDQALYTYYLGQDTPLLDSISDALKTPEKKYILSDSNIKSLSRHPNLTQTVQKISPKSQRVRAAMFEVDPSRPSDEPIAVEDKITTTTALHLAVIGNAWNEKETLEKLVEQIEARDTDLPFHGVIAVGDSIAADSVVGRLDFDKSFERPYGDLLERGIPFHGVIGETDEDIAHLLVHYPLLQMGDHRYYARDLHGGLVRFYSIDGHSLEDPDEDAEQQWAWLEADLSEADAPWKIVALQRPVLSMAERNENHAGLAERLLPLLDEHGVDIVMWGSENWYQRVEDPELSPVFFGVGWSGEVDNEPFLNDPRLKFSYVGSPGFLDLIIDGDKARFTARDIFGNKIDFGVIHRNRR